MMLQLVRRPYRLTKEFERAHIQLTRTWWTPLLEYQQARSFEQFALHIRAVNRSIKPLLLWVLLRPIYMEYPHLIRKSAW